MEPKIDLADMLSKLDDDHMCGYEYADTITLSNNYPNTTIAGGGYTVPNVTLSSSVSASSYPYTGGANTGPYTLGTGVNTTYTNPWSTYTGAPTLQLNGEGADIKVNDWSLVDAIKKLEERLNILTPNTKLETEWEELRALGDEYRKLEQHIKDKQATWDRLKAMPPPVIE